MSDTLITCIAIFLAATLMFVVPLMAVANNQEDVSQLSVQTAVQEFVDQAATKGSINLTDYDRLTQKLAATGNTYDIQIEVQHLDENPSKKVSITSSNLIGENIRYSTFTDEILEVCDSSNKYLLKKGDNVIATAKNTNVNFAQSIRNFAYKLVRKDTSQIGASAAAMVTANGK